MKVLAVTLALGGAAAGTAAVTRQLSRETTAPSLTQPTRAASANGAASPRAANASPRGAASGAPAAQSFSALASATATSAEVSVDALPLENAAPDLAPQSGASGRPTSSSFSEEVQLMRQAKDAVAQRQWPLAARLLAQHAERYPKGVFAPERAALDMITWCALSPGADRRAAAQRFLAQRGTSVLEARIRQACGLGEVDK